MSAGKSMTLRVGTWNLGRGEPRWRQPHQAAHISTQADLWLLTEVPSRLVIGSGQPSFSKLRPGERNEHWAAITFRWPFEVVAAVHPTLAMARIHHSQGAFLVASSVFPWRTAGISWPTGDGKSFAERCARTLAAHSSELGKAGDGLPIVWGGDFNQALSGRERAGSDLGRAALLNAFTRLGLRAVTLDASGQDAQHRSIDHIAIPSGWGSRAVKVQRPQAEHRLLSDHPSYVVGVEWPAATMTLPSDRSGSLQLLPRCGGRLVQV
jgi:hypothetical protein